MASSYPGGLDELTNGVPADGIAATPPLGSGTYPHDDHHRLLGEAVEAMQAELQGAYASYTPALTAFSSNPTLGTGSSTTGFYKRLGHRVVGKAIVTFGASGSSAGSGYYGLSLPVQPANKIQPLGVGFALDQSDSYRFLVCTAAVIPSLWAAATSKAVLLVSNPAGEGMGTGNNPVGAAAPWTWAENDQIAVTFEYEAAASA